MKGKLNLHNSDCMPALEKMDDNQFDLAIVDPPYGISNFWSGGDSRGKNYRKNDKNWNESIPTENYFRQLKRVSKNQIIWGWNYYTDILGSTESILIWYKRIGAPNYSVCDLACTSFWHKIKKVDINIKDGRVNGKSFHPCEKPIKLYKWCLELFAKEGQTILDTHLGSGSIAIACYDLGFDLTGYEIDKDYFEAIEKRIKQHTDQLTMI